MEQVLKGGTYVTPSLNTMLLGLAENLAVPLAAKSVDLTGRQREVLQLITEGRGNKEIAVMLRISVKTVEFHRGRIMRLLGVRSAAELGRFAVQAGLVES
jgi:DNA-binding NarL/FixJ family response regulator